MLLVTWVLCSMCVIKYNDPQIYFSQVLMLLPKVTITQVAVTLMSVAGLKQELRIPLKIELSCAVTM